MIMKWSLIPAVRAGARPRDPPRSPARPWSRHSGRPPRGPEPCQHAQRPARPACRHGHPERLQPPVSERPDCLVTRPDQNSPSFAKPY